MILLWLGLPSVFWVTFGNFARISVASLKIDQSCHAVGRSDMGFCVTNDQITGTCVGREAFLEKSTDCAGATDDWCCFGVSVSRQAPDPAHQDPSTQKRADSVDLAPCGHGSSVQRMKDGNILAGVRQFARVFEGTPTTNGDMCWVAAIFDKKDSTANRGNLFVCTASIINSTHIMTAGHCVDHYLTIPGDLTVQTGLSDASPVAQDILPACTQQFDVVEIVLPGRYDPDLLTEDHALLRIRGSIRADECSCRVCLPNRGAVPELSGAGTCWLAGFGSTREGGGGSLQLTKAPIQFVRRDRCALLLGGMLTAGNKRFPLAENSFCAGDAQQGGLCNHDGGAPLTCLIGGRHTLVGVGSWSVDCSKYPSVFSSIAACSDFLTDFNAPCDPRRATVKGAVALTDLQMNGGPTCGIPGDGSIDPFLLADQDPNKQQQDATNMKQSIQAIIAGMSPSSSLSASTGFLMMPESGIIPEIMGDREAKLNRVEFDAAGTAPPVRPIVGGVPAPLNQICWQVLLSTGCGGSIIADQFILTAAHCVTVRGTTRPRNPESIRVILGATASPVKFPLSDCQDIVKIRRIVVHENYFLGNTTDLYVANDIAILELEKPIDFTTPCVCRMCLQNNEPVPGEQCSTSGFGCEVPTPPNSACFDQGARHLMSLKVLMPGDDVCSAFFPNFPRDRVTCTASDTGHAPCFGDSGGPLVCYSSDKKTHYQAGVTSFAVFPDGAGQCGNGKENFQYYTKVNAFISWIQTTVPDVMVAESASFTFHASFNIDLGKGVSSIISRNQLLPSH